MNETHINVFDFDDTLFRVPNFTCSEARGLKPYEWLDSPKSLSSPVRVIPILNTLEKTWKLDKTVNYLITHRVEACKDVIVKLLKDSACNFKEIMFLGRADSKSMKLLEILDSNPNAKSLTIFEDSMWEIIQYAQVLNDEAPKLEINFAFVDKSKVIMLRLDSVVPLCDYVNYDRIRLI